MLERHDNIAIDKTTLTTTQTALHQGAYENEAS